MNKNFKTTIFIIVAIVLLYIAKDKYSSFNISKSIQACMLGQKKLNPEMTVDENLLMGGYLINSDSKLDERRGEVLDLFPKLGERKNQIASTLSGGERRMLAIGRGLMTGAKILLMDEPSLGLAPVVIEQIFESIRTLNNEGQTILLVEENVSRAINFSDHIYLLDEGQITWNGSGDELSKNDRLMEVYLGM